MTAPTLVDVWDVEHGVCIHLVTPNKKHVLIDCGSSQNFSPSIYLKEDLKIEKLDYVILSHLHEDHIRDIENINFLFDVKVLNRNKKIVLTDLKEENEDVDKGENEKRLDTYFDMSQRFNNPVKEEESPTHPEWGSGCTFRIFHNSDESLEVNDRSVAVFINFGNEQILYGADIKEKGWDELIKNNENFRKYAKKTTMYVAAHHGNKSGFSSKLFELFKPKLTIISAGKYRDFDGTYLYDQIMDDEFIIKSGQKSKKVKVISTRNNGNIKISIYDYKEPIVETAKF